MLKTNPFRHAALLALALCAAAAQAAPINLISNGNFSAGNLNGWSTYQTVNGINGSTGVQSFDVNGGGASEAASFNIGQQNYQVGVHAGSGISQAFSFGGGMLSFSLDIAARGGEFNNSSGGLFSLYLGDGNGRTLLDSFDFDWIDAGVTERASLSHAGQFAAGNYTLYVELTRPFITVANNPNQFVDNIAVIGEANDVPEPAGLALTGLALSLLALRRRQAR